MGYTAASVCRCQRIRPTWLYVPLEVLASASRHWPLVVLFQLLVRVVLLVLAPPQGSSDDNGPLLATVWFGCGSMLKHLLVLACVWCWHGACLYIADTALVRHYQPPVAAEGMRLLNTQIIPTACCCHRWWCSAAASAWFEPHFDHNHDTRSN